MNPFVPSELWRTAPVDFALPSIGGIAASNSPIPAPRLRLVHWPNGDPCWPLLMYASWLLRRGKSVGTVNTYMAELSVAIRCITRRGWDFSQLDDGRVFGLRDMLLEDYARRPGRRAVRGRRQTNRILARTLGFLVWLQRTYMFRPSLIGLDGEGGAITISYRRSYRGRQGLFHESYVSPDEPTTVYPMARGVFEAMLGACQWIARSAYVRERARVMLRLAADLGVRRSELVQINIRDIYDAIENPERGTISVHSAKRRGPHIRMVPIPRITLQAVVNYIEVQRAIQVRHLRKKYPGYRDSGDLLLSCTGGRIAVETITQDMHRLRRLADVEERASIHMLRHRWITLQVVEGIRAYGAQRLPVDMAISLLSRISSMTGHASVDSLWNYVSMTFDELGVWDRALENHTVRSIVVAIEREISLFRMSDEDSVRCKELLSWTHEALGRLLCVAASIEPASSEVRAEVVAPLELLLTTQRSRASRP